MKKIVRIFGLSFIFMILLSSNIFAESNVIIDSEIAEPDSNVSPTKLETDVTFNYFERWSKGTTVGMWGGETHVQVYIQNRGNSSFTFTVSSNPFFTNPVAVETLRGGQGKTIRVEYDDLHIYYAHGLVCDVYVQAYSYNNDVIGRLRVAGI